MSNNLRANDCSHLCHTTTGSLYRLVCCSELFRGTVWRNHHSANSPTEKRSSLSVINEGTSIFRTYNIRLTVGRPDVPFFFFLASCFGFWFFFFFFILVALANQWSLSRPLSWNHFPIYFRYHFLIPTLISAYPSNIYGIYLVFSSDPCACACVFFSLTIILVCLCFASSRNVKILYTLEYMTILLG